MSTEAKAEKYRNRHNPEVVVTYISDSEYRVGEMKMPSVIYTRRGKVYVRGKAEFLDKFEPLV